MIAVDLPTDRRALAVYAVGILAVVFLIFLKGVDMGINREREQHVKQDRQHLAFDQHRDAENARIRRDLALATKAAEDSAAAAVAKLSQLKALTIKSPTQVTVHRAPSTPDVTVDLPPEVIQRLEADAQTILALQTALARAEQATRFDSVTVIPDLRATIATSDTLTRDVQKLQRQPGLLGDVGLGAGSGALAGAAIGGLAGAIPGAAFGALSGAVIHGLFRR